MGNSDKFYNIVSGLISFEQVFEKIHQFISHDVNASYILSIGTDSHIHKKETRFITAIHLHRVGKGAWGCIRSHVIKRKVSNLHEKISLETALSQETASLFTIEKLEKLQELLLPNLDSGADFQFEIHIDIGTKGKTKEFIQEMTGRIEAMGIEARIKPDSYAAFGYANRYTK